MRPLAVLMLLFPAAHCFSGPILVSVQQRTALPRMEAAGDVAQLEAQIKILQLKAQIAEMQAQQQQAPPPADAPVPATAEVLASPPATTPVVPATPETVLASPPPPLPVVPAAPVGSQPPLPLPDTETCLDMSGNPRECTPADFGELVDLNELVGGIKPAFSFDVWPSLDKPETAIPLIGGFVVLTVGYFGVSRATKSLRPDDAATTRRKRMERERLGLSEADQDDEQGGGIAPDDLVAVVLIVLFELALFNLRNV